MLSALGPAAATTPTFRQGAKSALGGFGSSGLGGGIADIIGSIIGGGQQQAGFGDLESQIRQAIAGQGPATQQQLGLLQPFQTGGAQAFQQELGQLGQQPGFTPQQFNLPSQQDPSEFINQALSKFQQSPAQKAQIQAGLTAVQNRLGAQGLGGSGLEAESLEQFAQNQTGAQQQQFLQNVLGEQGRQQNEQGIGQRQQQLQLQQALGLGGLGLQQRGQTLGSLGQLGGLGLGAAQGGAGAIGQGQTNIAALLQNLGQTQLGAAQAQAQNTQSEAGGIGSALGGAASLAALFL